MKIRDVDADVKRKIVHWFDYIRSQRYFLEELGLLACLPDKLKAQIVLQVYRDTFRQVHIFKNCEPGLLLEIVLKLKLQVYCPGDYLCKQGDVGKEMYIVKSGLLKVIDNNGRILASLNGGSVFGEISVLEIPGSTSGNRRIANVVSVGYSECLSLCKQDLLALLQDYPKVSTPYVE
ncbi:hypothetical protein EB796_010631 [Bugula neritina]|uniref:Cyclic nucleotide-binding domain-containing protein n=1 Tax=Bugula neritina TaxID=10212 RepID=A0A7J7JXH4_BUGNE|nr:hypothetical protein EB796_010631 [Bugula neritina]